MLMFLLIFLLHYDVSVCNGTNAAKFNESSLLEKLYQNLVHVDTVLKEAEKKQHNSTSVLKRANEEHGKKPDKQNDYNTIKDSRTINKNWNSKLQKNLSAKLHQPPQYDRRSIQPTLPDRRQGFTRQFSDSFSPNIRPNFLVVPRPPSGYRVAIVPIKPSPGLRRPGFLHAMHPRLYPPRLLSDYQFQNVYLRPPGSHLPNPRFLPRPASQEFNQSYLEAELKSFHEVLPNIFNSFPFPSLPPFSDSPEWISQALTSPPPSILPNHEKGEEIWLTSLYNLYMPTHSSEMTVGTTTPHITATSAESTPAMSKINYYQTVASSAPSVHIGQLFAEDEQGYLYVTVPQKGGATVPAPVYSTNTESTAAGDVVDGKIKVQPPQPPQLPTQRYLELVVRLDEGYMVVFMLELCRLIALKSQKDVRQALYHTETIYNHWWNNDRLAWIEDPLQTVIWKLVILISEGDIEIVQTYASMMFHMLLRRKQTLSPEVNSILDKADLFYNDAEGQDLFKALMEFENYPNTTKSSYQLCDSLVESFLSPFTRGRQYRTLRRKKLLDLINNALKTRFPRILTEASKVKNHEKKRKREPYPYKLLRKRKKHRTHNKKIHYGKRNRPNIDYVNSILNIPPTKQQATFRAMPSKYFRLKTTPRTAREYSFNKRNRKLTHVIKTAQQEYDDNLDRIYDDSYKSTAHHHIFRKTSKHRPLRVTTPTVDIDLLRSSYFAMANDRHSHHHFFSRKTSSAEDSPPLRDTTPLTGSVFLRSSYFGPDHDRNSKSTGHHFFPRKPTSSELSPPLSSSYFGRNHDRNSKSTGHHFFPRKTSAAEHRHSLIVSTPTIDSVLLRSSYFSRNHDRNSRSTGGHFFSRKTSSSEYRHPLRDNIASTTSKFLRPSNTVHLKRHRNDKQHYYNLKETSEESESQQKSGRGFRFELLRKISAFPTMF